MLHQNDFDLTRWQFLQPQFLFSMVVIHNDFLYCGGDTLYFLIFSVVTKFTHTNTCTCTHTLTPCVFIHPDYQPSHIILWFQQPHTATYQTLRSPSALRTFAWLWWPWSGPPWSEADQSLGQGVGGSQTYSASPEREIVDMEFESSPAFQPLQVSQSCWEVLTPVRVYYLWTLWVFACIFRCVRRTMAPPTSPWGCHCLWIVVE